MVLKRVVVTGMGAITPLGNNLQAYWEGLLAGISGAAPITQFDAARFRTTFACEVKGFDPHDYFDKKEARKLDRYTQFAMVAVDEALKDSGLNLETVNKDRVGVIYGSGIGGLHTLEEEMEQYYTSPERIPRFSPFFIPKMILDIAPGQISIKYGFRGINYATVSACATSTHSMINAFNYIQLGKADIIVCGGSEAAVTQSGIGGFSAMKALSARNDDPATASRPFDLDRDGFVLGEGAGALIFEDYDHAVKRGARIYAEVVGAGMTADAYHITAPHPEGLGANMVMKQALNDAGMQPSDIDYINVHGTSTPLGDVSEVTAIANVFGPAVYDLNISSTKSMTGHLLGAAGAIEGIASILAVKHDIVPPTINHFTDDPALDPKINFTFNQPQKRTVRAALSNTFGFGGKNASVIVKKLA
ncbi:MAG: beta-ketoacyl-ACP synthase II [Chitinophagales bacterium]|nr:beta-ketoacyl-ACP synthase II [Chitinophagales bacterium]